MALNQLRSVVAQESGKERWWSGNIILSLPIQVASPLVRNTPVMTPYELCISINEVGGLSGLDGIVKVEVAVEDVIAGITGGRSTKAAAPGTLSGSVALRTTDVTNAARLLWTTQNQFSIPLTSLENHNLSLTIYYETEREKPTVIGVARNDSALGELLWSQVNRLVFIRKF